MKNILLLFISVTFLYATPLSWYKDFDKAKQEAQLDNKVIYALITTKTCKWCKKLKKTTLKKRPISKRLKGGYVLLELTRGEKNYPENLKAKMVPMNYFLTPDGRILYSIPGYWGEEDFMSILDDVDRKFHRQNQHKKYTK